MGTVGKVFFIKSYINHQRFVRRILLNEDVEGEVPEVSESYRSCRSVLMWSWLTCQALMPTGGNLLVTTSCFEHPSFGQEIAGSCPKARLGGIEDRWDFRRSSDSNHTAWPFAAIAFHLLSLFVDLETASLVRSSWQVQIKIAHAKEP